MVFKGFAKAHNYKGGFERWVYDTLKAQDERITALEEANSSSDTPSEPETPTEPENPTEP